MYTMGNFLTHSFLEGNLSLSYELLKHSRSMDETVTPNFLHANMWVSLGTHDVRVETIISSVKCVGLLRYLWVAQETYEIRLYCQKPWKIVINK